MKRNLKVRFIEEVGRYTSLVAIWDGECRDGPHHRAEIEYQEHPCARMGAEPEHESRRVTENDDIRCDRCGARPPVDTFLGRHSGPLWSNGKNKPEPGDMYYASWYHSIDDNDAVHCHIRKWENCKDPRGHLIVILPNGWEWDIDSRASNCSRKDDRTHRCWVRHGEPPNLTVDKRGDTCSAGAGSIIGGDWHGFLRNGVLEEC